MNEVTVRLEMDFPRSAKITIESDDAERAIWELQKLMDNVTYRRVLTGFSNFNEEEPSND